MCIVHPLQECVRVRSQQLRSAAKKRVPYRSSRLTMLLRDSFETEGDAAGKARTVVIVTVAPGCARPLALPGGSARAALQCHFGR